MRALGAVPREGTRRDRGSVLLAVLLVLVLACLIGTSIGLRASAEADAGMFRVHAAQARSAAWSGVLAAMVELESKRLDLLGGAAPGVTGVHELSRRDDGLVVEARIVAAEGAGGAEGQALCLGVNGTTAEMLRASGRFDEAGAALIASRAGERWFGSVEEAAVAAGGAMVGNTTEPVGDATRGRARVELTAWSVDPEVCAGVGDPGRAGAERVAWSSLAVGPDGPSALVRLVGPEAGAALGPLVAAGSKPRTRAELVAAMRRAGVETRWWGVVLDRVRVGSEAFVPGRVDVSGASAEVLACVPGIGTEHARALVRARERLGPEALRSLAWPVSESVLSGDEFERAVDHLTTRSAQFRVRVEGVVRRAGAGARGDEDAGGEGGDARPARVLARVVYDAVIDVSGEPARVAYLRDASAAEVAALVLGRGAGQREDQPEGAPGRPVDVPDRRAQNTAVERAPSQGAGAGSVPEPLPGRVHGRAGRWTPGPRRRENGG